MSKQRNLFDAIARRGTDDGYHPRITKDFQPTKARAGSPEKIAVLRWRVERGMPLWHRRDESGYALESDEDPIQA
jgi:hypothetical protein